MSKRVINPDQLQMLMKPSELRRSLGGSVDCQETDDPTADWEEKKTTRLKESIAAHGIARPVILDHNDPYTGGNGKPVMGNGHHRVQAAKEIEDSGKEIYVPVVHVEGDYMGWRAAKHLPGLSGN